jgi:hypothetical protein
MICSTNRGTSGKWLMQVGDAGKNKNRENRED